MSHELAIEVKNLTKTFRIPLDKGQSVKSKILGKAGKGYREFTPLNGVSFTINKGDFFAIVGRNGSGKSTLLKTIAGIYEPTKGKVSVDGVLVPFIELGVGFNPDLTGKENVYLNAALLGFSRKETDAMYDEVVDFAELHDFMEEKLQNYSSGMQVRLAFSIAIRAKGDILLLDEVLAVGDAAFQRKCFDYFRQLKKTQRTVILVSHSMDAVREYCNRGILIEEGKIVSSGDADKVADDYLSLFNKALVKNNGAASPDRKDNQAIAIDSITMKNEDDTISVEAVLTASNESFSNVVFGLRIKDDGGKLLAGVNNKTVDNPQKLQFAPNEKKVLRFTMQNIFTNKTYTISATVRSGDTSQAMDSVEDAVVFSSLKKKAVYPIVCPARLDIQ